VISAEALTCNDELVFSSVVIGRVLALRPYDINRPPTTWSHHSVWRALAWAGVTGVWPPVRPLLILLVISAPLSLSFYHLVSRENILEHVPTGDIQLSDLLVHIERADVTLGQPALVSLVLSAEQNLQASHVDELKAIISQELGAPIKIEVQSNIRR